MNLFLPRARPVRMLAGAYDIPGGTRFRGHTHDTPHLVAVLAGGFSERDGRSTRDVEARTLRLSGAARHDIDFGPAGARCLMVELTSEDVTAPPPTSLFLNGDPWLDRLLHRLTRSVGEADAELESERLIAELLAQIERRRHLSNRRASRPPTWLLTVRERVHDDPGLPPLAALAHDAGVHRVHLARAFRDHFGESLGEYARRRRLERARVLMEDEDLTLSQVAHLAGFADQSHLSRAVRHAFGTTPSRLRSRTFPRFKTTNRTRV